MLDEAEIDRRALAVMAELEREGSDILPHYLTLMVVEAEIARLGGYSPITGIDPITTSLTRAIHRLNRDVDLDVLDRVGIRAAIARRLWAADAADPVFDHR